MRRIAILMVAIAMVAAACGGSSDDGGSDNKTTTTAGGSATTTAGGSETTTTASNTEDTTPPDDSTGDVSRAVVTIDGEEFTFGDNFAADTCNPDLFGVFFAVLHTDDLSGNVGISLAPEGSGGGEATTEVTMTATNAEGHEYDLEADATMEWPAVAMGAAYVEDFTIDGNHASGTAYFADGNGGAWNAENAPLDMIKGTFDVTCASG